MPSIYQLTPPLLAMNAQRIDSPVAHLPIAYKSDNDFFESYPHRKTLLREAFMIEFDLDMKPGEWLQVPRLWCLVSQISSGIHSVVPVYRGRKFWSFIKDDAALAFVLVDIANRQGIDAAEFQAFERKVITKNQQALSSASGTIH